METVDRDRALQRRAIHDLLTASWPVQDIAEVLGVHRATVHRWLRDLESTRTATQRACADLAQALTCEPFRPEL